MLSEILFLFLIFIFALNYWFHYSKYAKAMKKIPGNPLNFFFGNSLNLMVPTVELFYLLRYWASSHNGIYRFYSYFLGTVEVYNPDDIEIITSNIKYHQKSYTYTLLKPWLGDGLLLSHGSKWQQRRKILTSAFHFSILQKYYLTIEENSKRLIKELERTNGKTTDIIPIISDFTLNTICETAMGTRLEDKASCAGRLYKEAIYVMGNVIVTRLKNTLLHFNFIFNRTSFGKKQLQNLKTIKNFTASVINERRQRFNSSTALIKSKTIDVECKDEKNRNSRKAMLDLLLTAERDGFIDSDGIQEEVDTFMFEGHDTTAGGLIYCLLSIANDKKVQDKIITELKSIYKDDTRQATYEDLSNMRYLDCCIKESLRLYPPVPFIGRIIPEDIVLSSYNIPAGTLCHMHIFDLHREERLFKNALKYDPDRFLPENCVGRHKYAYMPFSAGPRNCIGQKFAMMEMKSAVSAILRNFELCPVTNHSDVCFAADIVLRNTKPVYIKFVKRSI